MIRYAILICLLFSRPLQAQTIKQLDGKWCFTGLRTTMFKLVGQKLYAGMLEYADTSNFNRFVKGLPVDSTVFNEAFAAEDHDTIAIHVNFPSIDHDLQLLYVPADPTHIIFAGDVFFDSTRAIIANRNCNLAHPACINRLYSEHDLKAMMKLKTVEAFSRDDAFEFLLRLNENLKSRCNKCYAGFTDAYMNEVLIEMGFNPIVKRSAVNSVWYNTSGFTSYIKTKFQNDERMVKLADYIFEWYLK